MLRIRAAILWPVALCQPGHELQHWRKEYGKSVTTWGGLAWSVLGYRREPSRTQAGCPTD